MLDFQAIKASVSIETAAKQMKLTLHPEGQAFRSECPACKGSDRDLIITPAKGVFYCFKGKKGGDVIALVAHVYGMTMKQAAEWLAIKPETKSAQAKSQANGFDRAKYQASLDRGHELLQNVPEALRERADLGVSSKGTHKGLINIALYDKDTGEFICYAGVPSVQLPKHIA